MLYGFAARDVARIRQLLAAYERGRVRIDSPSHQAVAAHQVDTFLVYVGVAIPAGQLGTGTLVDLDSSTPTPVQSQVANVPTKTVYNPFSTPLAVGIYLVTREPSQGYYVPTENASPLTVQTTRFSNPVIYEPSDSWPATIEPALRLDVAAGGTYLILATFSAQIFSGSASVTSYLLLNVTTASGATILPGNPNVIVTGGSGNLNGFMGSGTFVGVYSPTIDDTIVAVGIGGVDGVDNWYAGELITIQIGGTVANGSGSGGGGSGGGGVTPTGIVGANGIVISPNVPKSGQVTIGLGTIDCGTWV